MNSRDELKTLIALNGNHRLPHLEEEIFADKILTSFYLHTLCKEYIWYDTDDSNGALCYRYAKLIIAGRWLAAECIIIKENTILGLVHYAKKVIKGQWPEAEQYIFAEHDYTLFYVRIVIASRMPAVRMHGAEQHIIKHPEDIYQYAKHIIKGRWLEAEPFLDAHWGNKYHDHFTWQARNWISP